jgi:hypothetical protein
MDHYYAEMCSGDERDFSERYMAYKLKRVGEISKIIKKNKIKNKDLNLGEKVKLFPPLLEKSKIRFGDYSEFEQIREFFSYRNNWYGFEMNFLAYLDEFIVYDKRGVRNNLEDKTSYQIRINPKRNFDFHQNWVNIRYFSKK